MRVVTLLDDGFDQICLNLAKVIGADYNPDLIIGVLTGGGFVGQRVFKYFSTSENLHYAEISIERATTGIKRKIGIRRFLKFLPEWMLNYLRVIEVLVLEAKARLIVPKRSGEIVLSEEVDEMLKGGNRRILVVDDCIDTGATLLKVANYFKEKYPATNQLKFAVITKAHRKVLLDVDFFLFNRVLIRFPWSMDNKR